MFKVFYFVIIIVILLGPHAYSYIKADRTGIIAFLWMDQGWFRGINCHTTAFPSSSFKALRPAFPILHCSQSRAKAQLTGQGDSSQKSVVLLRMVQLGVSEPTFSAGRGWAQQACQGLEQGSHNSDCRG